LSHQRIGLWQTVSVDRDRQKTSHGFSQNGVNCS